LVEKVLPLLRKKSKLTPSVAWSLHRVSAVVLGSARVSRAGEAVPGSQTFPFDTTSGKPVAARTPQPARETRALPTTVQKRRAPSLFYLWGSEKSERTTPCKSEWSAPECPIYRVV